MLIVNVNFENPNRKKLSRKLVFEKKFLSHFNFTSVNYILPSMHRQISAKFEANWRLYLFHFCRGCDTKLKWRHTQIQLKEGYPF